MAYHLLTGATTPLGQYLLRDFLSAGRRLAVLVRPSRRQSARGRIESILARWESGLGYTLPRPVVLEGDLTQEDLDLDSRSVRWIADHCKSVLHAAGNTKPRGKAPSKEPWLSNVQGTRHLLELCRCTGIHRFHFVSSVYVCGRREGPVFETELDPSAPMPNDFAASMAEAEQMVSEAVFLDPPTIYRPAMLVGDSETGWTTRFDGFYAMLRLAQSRADLESFSEKALLAELGLDGSERKNLVPIDWVSQVIARIHRRRGDQGRTYHLAAPERVSTAAMAEVCVRAAKSYVASGKKTPLVKGCGHSSRHGDKAGEDQSIWADDPEFDCGNTRMAALHDPCPPVDVAMLERLAGYALESHFGRPRPEPVVPEFDAETHLKKFLDAEPRHTHDTRTGPCLGMEVSGPGGGQWKLIYRRGKLIAAEEGIHRRCSGVFFLSSKTLEQMIQHEISAVEAVELGRVLIEGNGMETRRLVSSLQAVADAHRFRGISFMGFSPRIRLNY